MLGRVRLNMVAVWGAHLWAWGIALFLALVPVYRNGATVIEQNGLYLIWILLFPVLLSGIVLLAIHFMDAGHKGRKALLWMIALVLLGLCIITIISIGLLYLPMALALLIAAIRERGLTAVRWR